MKNIYISTVKRLIMINCIQNKVFVYIIYVCTVYIYYVYIYKYKHIHVYIYLSIDLYNIHQFNYLFKVIIVGVFWIRHPFNVGNSQENFVCGLIMLWCSKSLGYMPVFPAHDSKHSMRLDVWFTNKWLSYKLWTSFCLYYL